MVAVTPDPSAAPPEDPDASEVPWWKGAVFYQVYPRSFADANGDGVGDLAGILDRVDHLADLGIDAVWLSPFYESPMRDNGYDVSDHRAVDPVFGTLEEFDAVVAALHERDIRLIVDFVPNHVSSDHPWFVESRSSRESPKRDWFIWADPSPDGSPPTNWTASFTKGSTWELDEATGQYYLHLFLPEQPDVNWANPEVEAAQLDVLRFWMDRGVDGFRMDVLNAIGKDPEPRDVPDELVGVDHVVLTHHETAMPRIRRIREVVDPPGAQRVVVGEIVTGDVRLQATYCGDGDGVSCTVNFASVGTPWERDAWRTLIADMEDAYADDSASWPSYVLSNHDNARHRTRYGGSEARARAAAVLLLGLRGTPFLYQGEELGLEDAVVPQHRALDPGGRDGCRAPVPWRSEEPHGWGPEPWLPFPPEAAARAAEVQRRDPDSVLALYRRIIAARKASPALQHGRLELLDGPDDVLAFRRVQGEDERLVLVAFGAAEVDHAGEVVVASSGSGDGEPFRGRLAADEAVVLRR